jgi:hypothetical protein
MRLKGNSQIVKVNPLSNNPPSTGNAKTEEDPVEPESESVKEELSPANECCAGFCLYYVIVIGGLCAVIGMN